MTTLHHTPEKVNRVIRAVQRFDEIKESFIAWAVARKLPYLDAQSANMEIVRLHCQILELQAKIDAAAMREKKDA